MNADLSEIFKDHIHELNLTPLQKKIANKIIKCQTSDLGHHHLKCSNKECSHKEILYNSCKSIYCPKCQNYSQIKWTADRMGEVLPVDYMHMVFSVPTSLRTLIQYNPKPCLNALSSAAKKALHSTFAKDKNQIGAISVIHTNTQLLNHSPHIHCLVPKGYLNSDRTKWVEIKRDAKYYRDKLSIQFKINLLKELEKTNKNFDLIFPENHILRSVKSAIEYAKKCNFRIQVYGTVNDINHALRYLGYKTRKVIINNKNIVSYKNNIVRISWSDRRDNRIKEVDIDVLLFLKRFMLHILPLRFTRIRYYGFLSNSCKKHRIELCRELIRKARITTTKLESKVREDIFKLIERITQPVQCPVCYKGFLVLDGL